MSTTFMDSQKILYSTDPTDVYHTPSYAVWPIASYLPKDAIIWCPFDTENSWYVKFLGSIHKVVRSHKTEGKNFYSYEPPEWDIIVSNPPFTNKRQTFERALSFNKPFALLMSNTWLNDSAPKILFKDKDLQLLMFDRRIKFLNGKTIDSKITFSSSYYCWNLLPKQIIMERLY